jgi:hypothetical protein
MVLFVAYLGDYDKRIVGAFSSLEKAKMAVDNMQSAHIVAHDLNKLKGCDCLLCQPTEDNPDGTDTLWIAYADWDRFNDRPHYTIGIQRITDYAHNDTIRHVVKVQLDVAIPDPQYCTTCTNCVERQQEEEDCKTRELIRAEERLQEAQIFLNRVATIAA